MSERKSATRRVREAATPLDAVGDGTVTVGIRELRDHLSQYLDLVKDGQSVRVTDHGAVIASIVPMRFSARTMELYAQGKVRLPKRPKSDLSHIPRGHVEGGIQPYLDWAKSENWELTDQDDEA
jgi:prevent-host-death family protein